MLKSGSIYKLGEGPINYNWNLRYVVLDCNDWYLLFRGKLRAHLLSE